MAKSTLRTPEAPARRDPTHVAPMPVGDGTDILDWDVTIETPPIHRSGTLRVALKYAGRSRPIAVIEPPSDG